jgi:hypothetical protein
MLCWIFHFFSHFICADCAPLEVQRTLEAIQEAEPLAHHRAQGLLHVCAAGL